MFCNNCGSKIDDGQLFCPACGAKQGSMTDNYPAASGDQKQKKPVKKFVLIGVILLLLAACAGGAVFALKYFSAGARTERLLTQGEQYISEKEYDLAEASFREALEIAPDSADAYKGLVKVYEKTDDPDALMAVLEEAVEATGDKYFSRKLGSIDDDNRRSDVETAEMIREAVLADIADGVLTGRDDLVVKKGKVTTIDETYKGLGSPAKGYNFVAHYDADYGICYVSLNGFVLTSNDGINEYLEYDGELEDREDLALLASLFDPGDSSAVITPDGEDHPGLVTSESVHLTMWCPITEGDVERHAYEAAIAEMAEEYPGITLDWEAYEREAYKTKIKAAVAADELPDIFVTWSGAFLQDFVDAGRVYCLDDYYPDYCNDLPEGMLSTSTYAGKHYGIPINYNAVVLYANMDVLAEAGYDEIPDTYNDLIECCEALKKKGIYAFSCAGNEVWCVSEYLETIFLKTIGSDPLNEIFLGRATWNNPGIADSVDMLQGMISDYFDPDGINMSNEDVKTAFMNGDFAFYINGTWNCIEFSFYNIEVGEMPVIDSRYAGNGSFIGGPSEVIAVAESSARRELAAQYGFELAKRISFHGYLEGNGLPSWRIYDEDESGYRLLRDSIEMCTDAKMFVLYGDTAMGYYDFITYYDYLSMVYDSSMDGQEFAEALTIDIR